MSETINKTEIDALNDITKVLIDSRKGYEKCAELTDESFTFRSQFQKRASDRAALISRFQQQVRTLGGEPQTDGGTMGTLHSGRHARGRQCSGCNTCGHSAESWAGRRVGSRCCT